MRIATHLTTLDLVQGWHDIQPHQLASLSYDRVSLHTCDSGDLALFGLVRNELRVPHQLLT